MSGGRFENGGLYRLLPAVVRLRDEQTGWPLLEAMKAFGEQADRIEANIAESYENLFVETAGSEALTYIADLIGYRPISVPGAHGSSSGEDMALLRRDIGRTIWARRRKGAAHVIGKLVTMITGWHAVVFENSRNVIATPSTRSGTSRSATQGTPDFRKLTGTACADQGPGLIPRLATVGRADVDGGGRRWHPLDVVVEVWPHHAYLIHQASAGHRNGYWTFDAAGGDTRLYAPARSDVEVTSTVESVRALHLDDFAEANFKMRVYGPGGAVCLYLGKGGREPVAVQLDKIVFGQVPIPIGNHLPGHERGLWVIDPARGRIASPPVDPESQVYVRYLALDPSAFRQGGGDDKTFAFLHKAVRVRLEEHVPLETHTGLIIRL